MHVFDFEVQDDGRNAGALRLPIDLVLSSLGGTMIAHDSLLFDVPELPDTRAGYFHAGTLELRHDEDVFRVLGKNCVPSNPP